MASSTRSSVSAFPLNSSVLQKGHLPPFDKKLCSVPWHGSLPPSAPGARRKIIHTFLAPASSSCPLRSPRDRQAVASRDSALGGRFSGRAAGEGIVRGSACTACVGLRGKVQTSHAGRTRRRNILRQGPGGEFWREGSGAGETSGTLRRK